MRTLKLLGFGIAAMGSAAMLYMFSATVMAALGNDVLYSAFSMADGQISSAAIPIFGLAGLAGMIVLVLTTDMLGASVGRRLNNASQFLAEECERATWERCRRDLRRSDGEDSVVLTERSRGPRGGVSVHKVKFDIDAYSLAGRNAFAVLKDSAPRLLRFPVWTFFLGALAYTVALTLVGVAAIGLLAGQGLIHINAQQGALIVLDAVQRGGLLDLYESFGFPEPYTGPSPIELDALEFVLRTLSSVLLVSFVISGARLLLAGRALRRDFDLDALTASGLACHTLTVMQFVSRLKALSRYLQRGDAVGLDESRLQVERNALLIQLAPIAKSMPERLETPTKSRPSPLERSKLAILGEGIIGERSGAECRKE
ncbi:hypothetical protein [Candidatus Viadribacter manganicus]|uniref:hypothetical protein n=1 Tax=Candidatus Viadribacter manganicus TaxID=1759059 RepID=UPI0012EA1D0D|nr:hypothetical protein [Candidatus Viadribacter manganicus]